MEPGALLPTRDTMADSEGSTVTAEITPEYETRVWGRVGVYSQQRDAQNHRPGICGLLPLVGLQRLGLGSWSSGT